MNGINTSSADVPQELVERCDEFLTEYCSDDIGLAVQGDTESIRIDWADIHSFDQEFAYDFINSPRTVLEALRGALHLFEIPVPGAESELSDLDVRVHNVSAKEPVVSELRSDPHLGNYIGLRGQVSLASQVQPKLMQAMFRCERCSSDNHDMAVGPIEQVGDEVQIPSECPSCERNGPFSLLREKSVYLDHQIVELTDPPGENPGSSGNVVPVHLYGEMAGEPNAGDRVRVNGILDTESQVIRSGNQKLNRRLDWDLTGHAIDAEETAFEEVEPEQVERIQELGEQDDIAALMTQSFAPDILTGDRGDKHKLAALLSMFGGNSENGRDDINLFYIGAPGTGKSQYLGRVTELAPKAVEASGKGATAAGLTATATQSDLTGKWMLDAGALVLASGGVACIDEFDKMADSVRQSMHEAMENQRVPINKAGINTTLTTETTVIAAANPKHGSFDRYSPLNEQVNLGSPLLSRFDLIFGVSDTVDAERDGMIADHQHERAAGTGEQAKPLSDELMTEYIAYARQNIFPTYESAKPKEMLVDYYTEKRQESDGDEESVTPVTPRMNDALRRLAQASARMHLRDEITVDDAERAIELMDMTLGDTALESDGTLNAAKAEGRNRTQSERKETIRAVLRDADDPIVAEQIAKRTSINVAKVRDEIQKFRDAGEVYEPQTGNGYVLT